MNKLLAVLLTCLAMPTSAALIDRGGGLIYDDVLNITWLQDANYGAGSSYDNGSSTTDGRMTWDNAVAWATNLSYYDSVRNITYDDWRLPTLGPVNGSSFNYNFSFDGSTDLGYNITSPLSELAYMYYANLGLKGSRSPTGAFALDFGLWGNGTYNGTDTSFFDQRDLGLINNLVAYVYWTGLEYVPNPLDAWYFTTGAGGQFASTKEADYFAWAVRPGDVAAIPEPSTYVLMLAGLGMLGFALRRNSKQVV